MPKYPDKLKIIYRCAVYLLSGLFLFLVVFAFSIVLHEICHFFTAIAVGVPLSEIHFAWYEFGPGLAVSSVPLKYWPLLLYSGGIFAGALFALAYWVYVIQHYRQGMKPGYLGSFSWVIWYFILGCAELNLYVGLTEGSQNEAYMAGNIDYIIPFAAIFISSFIIHLLVSKTLEKKWSIGRANG